MSFRNVSTLKHGDIALIEFHYPPVNALGASVRTGIFSKLQELIADTSIKAIVLKGKGRFFSGGADINEFGIESAKPTLRELINAVEASEKPIIAAIDGAALGGGMELALGCHYRVGSVKAKLGLPEVKLGLLPGAGGTQRLPRLIGPIAALELIVEGDLPLMLKSALKLGLLDQIIGDEVNNGDIAFARNFLNKPIRRLSQDNSMIDAKDRRAFENDAARLLKRNRGLEAPKACVQAIRDTFELSFIEASQRERHAFMRLLNGSESKAQRHLFFAERKALKVPGLGKEVKPRDVKRIAVIGAGTMGSGIAMCLTINGFRVTLIDINPDNLKLGLERIRNNFKRRNLGVI